MGLEGGGGRPESHDHTELKEVSIHRGLHLVTEFGRWRGGRREGGSESHDHTELNEVSVYRGLHLETEWGRWGGGVEIRKP